MKRNPQTESVLLFDYACHGQLGLHIRDAEKFRGLAISGLR